MPGAELLTRPVNEGYCRDMPTWVLHVIGNIGVLMILGAYFLVSSGRIKAVSSWYQGLNLVGAVIMTVYSAILFAWASVALNSIWAVIAVVALIMNTRKARSAQLAEQAAAS